MLDRRLALLRCATATCSIVHRIGSLRCKGSASPVPAILAGVVHDKNLDQDILALEFGFPKPGDHVRLCECRGAHQARHSQGTAGRRLRKACGQGWTVNRVGRKGPRGAAGARQNRRSELLDAAM